MQSVFYSNYERLLEKGLLFPKSGYEKTSGKGGRNNTTSGHNEIISAALGGKKQRDIFLNKLNREISEAGVNKVFMSAENITHYVNGDMAGKLKKLFGGYSSVRVVFTLREPIGWIESYYRELVGNGWEVEYRSINRFIEKYRNIFCVEDRIKRYEKEFGLKNVSTIVYGREIFSYGIENVFLNYCGIDDVDLVRVNEGVNKSSSNEFVQAVLEFNKSSFGGEKYRSKIYSISSELRTSGDKSGLLGVGERFYLCDFFHKKNKYLYIKNHFFGSSNELRGKVDSSQCTFDVETYSMIKRQLGEGGCEADKEFKWLVKAKLKSLPPFLEVLAMRVYYKLKRG
ncbi:hypothetical protein IOQ59_14190 [Pontibacterium sp. N1Y112]|uniref:Sulfotransferase domain-containing protein n=1 Tax=Pontibacterium sinense TaxID=2781979 RepID=A0A8J7FE55_9GAMM|nr:hypothetical protein [Pontibacterium sinense]MBE9398407.1 hypothetical protein [Pontibacterium sinense]